MYSTSDQLTYISPEHMYTSVPEYSGPYIERRVDPTSWYIYTREIRDINRHIYKFIYGQFYMYMHIHLVTLLASLFIACLDIQVHVCVHGPVHRHVYAYTAAAGRSLISFLACLLHSLLYGTNAHTYNLILACLPCLARDVHGGHATSSAKPAWFWYLDLE